MHHSTTFHIIFVKCRKLLLNFNYLLCLNFHQYHLGGFGLISHIITLDTCTPNTFVLGMQCIVLSPVSMYGVAEKIGQGSN